MNYHFIIDHWLLNDFIETAERITPGKNVYVYGDKYKIKHLKSQLVRSVAFESNEMQSLVGQITKEDRIYVHWFHSTIMTVMSQLSLEIPLYLFFWGGDFIGQTPSQFRFNIDNSTWKYLREKKKKKTGAMGILGRLKRTIKEKIESRAEVSSRRKFFARLDYFCHWNVQDMKLVTSIYGGNPDFRYFFYDGGWDLIPLTPSPNKVEESFTSIWLGNSDTVTNNHLDAIEALSAFNKEDIRIKCPLSYGVNVEYGDYVTTTGHKAFGEKWFSIRDFMSVDKYIESQKNVDVVVMFHNRTQAAGNIIAFVKMGKKIYLKGQSTLYHFLKENNIIVFDANEIKTLSFSEFCLPLTEDQARSNALLITELFTGARKEELDRKILEKLR